MTAKKDPKDLLKVGRPRLFEKPEEMQPLIDEYFDSCKAAKEPYTIPGLANHLGFEDRHGPSQYAQKYPEFISTIKRARLCIEAQRNEQLVQEGNAAGKIFDLVNNFSWQNPQQKIKHSGDTDEPLLPDVSKLSTETLRKIIELGRSGQQQDDDESAK